MWKLDGSAAHLESHELSGTIDLGEPHLGVRAVRVRGNNQIVPEMPAGILQVHFPVQPAAKDLQDSWVRGDDVVAIYLQTKARQVRPEIYWRLIRQQAVAIGIELILSVQTDLLDAAPSTSVASQLAAEEVVWLKDSKKLESANRLLPRADTTIDREGGQPVFIFRVVQSPFSYVEMIHPTDFCSAVLSWVDGYARLRSQLFLEFLEKGVIRRGRVRGVFVPRSDDLSAAARSYQEFNDSPPPLTT